MSRHLTRIVIGAGITVSLLGWSVERLASAAIQGIRPAAMSSLHAPLPHVSIQFSIEVRP